MSNAAVMGVVPRFRYVLLSDLLIETLSPRQVEAVFAHEVGHVRHHHMLWYLLFVVSGVLLVEGAAELLGAGLDPNGTAALALDWTLSIGGLLLIVLMFGLLSRRCERQSDLFAARALIREPGEPALAMFGATAEPDDDRDPEFLGDDPRHLPVKPHGAEVFAETLRRVAEVNGIPLHPRPRTGRRIVDWFGRLLEFTGHFLHGSIAQRMQFVRQVAADPAATRRYDAAMRRLFGSVAVLLLLSLLLLLV
jgi:STE24 endopeptidase